MRNLEIIIPAKSGDIEKVTAAISAILIELDFLKETVFNIQLALEEVIVNIIEHGYQGKDGLIMIKFVSSTSQISIEISDSAPAFNPLLIPKPDLTADIEERSIGGLGIFLVRKVMDIVTYRYENNRNILTLIKVKEKK